MADETQKANLTAERGRQAAKMPHDEAKAYIAGSANVDKDFQKTAEETAGTGKKQQMQEVLGSMAKGGTIPKTGLYKMHAGEKVIPNGRNRNKISSSSSAAHKRYDFGKNGDC